MRSSKLLLPILGLLLIQVNCIHEINHDTPDIKLPFAHKISTGKCPYQPAEIKTNVTEDNFDFHKLEGMWKIMYDEKQLNDNFTCMGVKFIHTAEDGHDVLEVMQSLGVTSQFREYIAEHEQGQHEEAHEYYTNIGRQLNFRHPTDKALGYLEPFDIHMHTSQATLKQHEDFDPQHWDTQYLRFSKVLDTDNENFVILYTCQESARYFDRENKGEEISHADAHYFAENRTIHDMQEKPEGEGTHHHTYTSFKLKDNIEVAPVHVQSVQILWRAGKATIPKHELADADPDTQNQEWETVPEPTPEEMDKMIGTITTLLPKAFPKAFLEKEYAWMNHAANSPLLEHDYAEEQEEEHDPHSIRGKLKKPLQKEAGKDLPHHHHQTPEELKCDYDPYHMHGYDQGLTQSSHVDKYNGDEHEHEHYEHEPLHFDANDPHGQDLQEFEKQLEHDEKEWDLLAGKEEYRHDYDELDDDDHDEHDEF